MAIKSGIEWTNSTWNPVRGCTKISPGCSHCYAATFAERFRGVPGHPFEQGFDLRIVPEKLNDPLDWKSPRMIFVNSMSDLFQEEVSTEYIARVCTVMTAASQHTYQVLTKRSHRLFELMNSSSNVPMSIHKAAQAQHIWWGVSVEDRKYGLPRIDDLRRSAVQNKFLSIEPLLEDLGTIDLSGVGWVIVGGESGAHARPVLQDWVISIRDQCFNAKVPFFFKQWGGLHKKAAGKLLQGREYCEFPAFMRPSSAVSFSIRM